VSTAIITGAAGLIGSEAVRTFHELGWDIIGIDNDMRGVFFGPEASTKWMSQKLQRELHRYKHLDLDICNEQEINRVFREAAGGLKLIIHTAAQPSHDWAARDPMMDFKVNALGTLILLEATRQYAPEATFIFTSTNKVYGDLPNFLPLVELETRYELAVDHPWFGGIPETMSIDQSTHSLFGVSKAAADLLVQEYGRYFGMATVVFRGGCLTGPGHSGTELHGFLAYLMKCTATDRPYTVYGYHGKQVRDNIHSADLIAAFVQVASSSPRPSAVYNIGGGRNVNCSMLEAIELCQEISGRKLLWSYSERNRIGDHIWYVSDLSIFQKDYPEWSLRYNIETMLQEIFNLNQDRWQAEVKSARV
jgi:CDP-paratose 2-epimerase